MNFSLFDTALHIIELLVTGAACYYIREVAKLVNVSRSFPPHRHIGDDVVYSREFPPAKAEHLRTAR